MKKYINIILILLLLVGCTKTEVNNPEIDTPEINDPEVSDPKVDDPIVSEDVPDKEPDVEDNDTNEDEIIIKKEASTKPIDFKTIVNNDNTINLGETITKTKGKKGVKTLYYEVTYVNGKELNRKLIKEEVTTKSTDQIVHKGTKVEVFNGQKLGKELMNHINRDRKKEGAPELIWSNDLYKAAAIRSDEIIKLFSHTRPDGSEWYTASDLARGENISYGYNSSKDAHNGFQSSPPHRANNMNKDFKTVGISASRHSNGSIYWAVLFGY